MMAKRGNYQKFELLDGLKKCKDCGEIKELELFPKDKNMKSGYQNACKECKSIYMKAYTAKYRKTEGYRNVQIAYQKRTQKNQRWLE